MRSRQYLVAVCVTGLGLLASGEAARAEPSHQTVSLVVKATGKKGSIERVNRPERRALGSEVNAGVIPRAALQAELANGIGRFLQQVRVQAVLARGRFVGWRVLTLFPARSDIQAGVLRPGDLVMRINGESIERPEDFKAVWDSLASASEIVVDIEREGEPSSLRYTIQ